MDLKLTSYNYYSFIKKFTNNESEIVDINLVEKIWDSRPVLKQNDLFLLDLEHSGEEYLSKLSKVKENMKKVNADSHLITKLDDVNYLLNLRGNDISYTPYFLGYFLINENKEYLYVNKKALNEEIVNYLDKNNVIVKDYFEIYEDVKNIKGNILLHKSSVNTALINNLSSDANIIHSMNYTQKLKAVKNETEIKNTKNVIF
jgi:Xaa-Pro aminopeptidase